MYENVFAALVLIFVQYLIYVAVGKYAIKWNNEWKAALIPYVISLVVLIVYVLVLTIFMMFDSGRVVDL